MSARLRQRRGVADSPSVTPTPARRQGRTSRANNTADEPVETVEVEESTNAAPATSTAGSRSTVVKLPPYEEPIAPLTPQAAQSLSTLLNHYPVKRLTEGIKDAAAQLTEVASDINARLGKRERQHETNQQKRANNGEEDAELDEEKENFEQYQSKAQKMTERMDLSTRKMVDSTAAIAAIKVAHDLVIERAGSASAAAVSQSQAQTQTQSQAATTQRSVTLDPAVDAQPQDPPPPPALMREFEAKLQDRSDLYTSLSLRKRYAQDNMYAQFKSGVHYSRYEKEGEPAPDLPHASTWFPSETLPAPGVTATAEGASSPSAAMPDGDEDIAVARERISTRCPVTLLELADPVTSTKCPHTFERAAILGMIARQARRPGERPSVQCPVAGCSSVLTKEDVAPDAVLVRRIRRIQRAREMMREEAEEEGGDGRTVEEVESDSGDDIDAVETRAQRTTTTPAVRVKREQRGGGRRRNNGDDIEDD